MEDNLNEIVIDAVKITDQLVPPVTEWSDELCDLSKQNKSVIKKLSSSDFKIIFFLLIDYFGVEDYLKIVHFTKEEFQQSFFKLCHDFGAEKNDLIVELMGIMKKYKLLKDLGCCKHHFKSNWTFRFIGSVWRFLFSICDSLRDIDVMKLKSKLLPKYSSSVISAEELLTNLLLNKFITKTDLSNLETVFEELPRLDLVEKLKQFQRGSSEELEKYRIKTPTQSIPCGLAVIFNQVNFLARPSLPLLKERKGSTVDKDYFISVCKEFGLRIEEYTDLSAKEIENKFEVLSKRDNSDFDVFVACILSHGEQDHIYGSDSIKVNIENLISLMANKCPTLNGKPKLFFIQACQGNLLQEVLTVPKMKQYGSPLVTDGPRCSRESPMNCDVLKAMATVPGFVSYRSEDYGSWFIKSLVDKLRKFGDKEDIESIMKRVKAEVADADAFIDGKCYKQMPVGYSTLRFQMIFKRLR